MTRHSIALVDHLRHGLASAVLSAAALAAPAAEAIAPQLPMAARNQGGINRPSARGQGTTPATTTAPKPSPSTRAKPQGPAQRSPSAAAGCGAHEGGCGPSR